jgi:hypothetical protein
MRIAALKRTVKHLAALAGSTGPCPFCRVYLVRDPNFYSSEERQGAPDDAPEPPSCPVCGRRPFVVRLVRDPNFYSNRERLDALEEM